MILDFKKEMSVLGFLLVALFLVSQNVSAYQVTGNAIQTNTSTITAGITPDSWLYFLDVALDRINLALTLNPTERAKKGLNIARERLMEMKKMISENKLNDSRISQREYINALNVVQSSVKEIKKTNSTQDIKDQINIEKDLVEHRAEITTVEDELNVRMKVKGNVTQEQQALVDSMFGSLNNKTGEVEKEVENEKSKIKIKMQQQTGQSEKEVETEIRNLEKSSGLSEIRKEKAWNKIKDTEEEINKTIKRLKELNISNGDIPSALNNLNQAKDAYFIKNYKDALVLATQSENKVKSYRKQFEKKLEREREIEVETENNQSRVKVDISGTKVNFVLDTSNKDKIISEIVSRTGLSKQEIKRILQVKKQKPEQEIEIGVKIGNRTSNVRTSINHVESNFILNMTNKQKIISEISLRTGLTKDQIEKNIEFDIKEIQVKEIEKEDNGIKKVGNVENIIKRSNRTERGIKERETPENMAKIITSNKKDTEEKKIQTNIAD